MRFRFVLALAVLGILVIGIPSSKLRASQDTPAEISLGGAIWSPATIPPGNTSTLRVSVATTPSVPTTGIKAILTIFEFQNFGGVSYSITPAQTGEVVLAGGGRASIGEFTLSLNSQNTGRGNVVYRVNLTRLENLPQGVTVNRVAPTVVDATLQVSPTPTPTPSPTPTPTPVAYNPCDDELLITDCLLTPDGIWKRCRCYSPVIIDVQGNGFDLTNAQNGVNFDIVPGGLVERVAWTTPDSDDAFLFLDGNENGLVDNGAELFGDFTTQQPPPAGVPLNGFNALATYDRPGFFGGNGDGVINHKDEVFSQLRLWRDMNHNGICEPRELSTLPELGIESISLDYRESRQRDRYGNLFRYRAKVYGTGHRDLGRWAYDVFLGNSP